MAQERFDPNRADFAACLERLRGATDEAGLPEGVIITSKDEAAVRGMDILAIDNVPDGFRKWQLPVYLSEPSHMFISVAEPGVKVPSHSHDEGDGIRFIAGGSITYEGQELTAGDWMFIPAGESYSFEVGRFGAIMCYC
jgi:hypothetical protein